MAANDNIKDREVFQSYFGLITAGRHDEAAQLLVSHIMQQPSKRVPINPETRAIIGDPI